MEQSVAPSGVVGGPLFPMAVVEVLVAALVEALPHRCWPWVGVVGEGVVRPVVAVPGDRVWHRQAARVAVPQLGGTQRDNVARGDCSKEGPYQDRPPLCPFRLLPLLIYSGSVIAFLKFQRVQSPKI